jgi:hypothetical protein
MRAATVAAVILLASLAAAQEIQRWRTPDGKLYFGFNPPEGSTLITAPEREPARPTSPPASRPHVDPRQDQTDKASAYATCSAAVNHSLDASASVGPPGSTRFSRIYMGYRVEGYVDVKPSTGPTSRRPYRCEAEELEGVWRADRFTVGE